MMINKKKTSFVYFLGFIAIGLIGSFIGPSLPSFAESTSSSLKQLSNLFVMTSIGYMIGSFVTGQILNKVSGHRLMAAGLIFLAIFTALLPLIGQLWVFVTAFFLIGIFQSQVDVSENTLLIWLHGRDVTYYMNSLHFSFGIGTLIAPLIVAQSLQINGSINAGIWIIAAFLLIPAFMILRYPSPTEPIISLEQNEVSSPTGPKVLIILLLVMFFGFVGAQFTFGNWIYTFSLGMRLTNVQQAAYLTSSFWFALTLSRFLSITLAKKITSQLMMCIDLIGCVLSILLILIWNQSEIILWIGTIGFGFFTATAFPTALNLAGLMGVISAKTTRWFFIASSLAVLLSPRIVGQFFESSGPLVFLWVVFANTLIALIFYVFIRLIQRNKKTLDSTG